MSRGRRRARELHDEAARRLAEQDLPERDRVDLGNARSIATLAHMLYEAGHPDGGEALSVAEQVRGDALLRALRPDAERSQRSRKGSEKGGRERGAGNRERDISMAQDFQARRSSSRESDSALKARIGRENGLSRSAAIEAVNRGLQFLSG